VTSGAGARDGAEASPTAPAPSTASLAALPSDAAAWLLPHVRAALHALEPGDVTPVVRRLRAAPTGRLAGGRVQRELHELLAAGGPAWRALVTRIHDAADAPPAVARLVTSGPGEAATTPSEPAPPPPPPTAPPATRSAGEERARARLREVRAERDELRRQLAGATARTVAVEAERDRLDRDLAAARARLAELEAEVAGTEAARERAVDRERRRRDAEVARLEATVAELRRADQERRAAARRREERAKLAEQEAARAVAARRREVASSGTGRLVPGRPSRLPADVRPGTTEAADLLLHRGRRVLVDGYNVTRQHQADLDLEGQRTWLIRVLANLAARRRIEPTVVFDGQGAASSRPAAGSREVREVFTPSGVTADDELVLAAEATDEPLVVVTDDRELTDRLAATGVDVVGTRPFLGVAR
jgi:hypothetical protein